MFALQNFEVGGSVLIEKMHTPETNVPFFKKKSPVASNFLEISFIKYLLLG